MKKLIIFLFIFSISSLAYAVGVSDLVKEQINNEDGFVYSYDSYWSKYDNLVQGNLDDDPEKEIVVSFGATSKKKEDSFGITMHFWQIYDLIDGEYQLIKTTWANQYPGKLALKDLNKDGVSEIMILSHGGAHYTNIYFYQWQGGNDYEKIWENGSGCGIEVMLDEVKPKIKVGIPNWDKPGWCYASEPLRAMYEWNGKTFVYNEKASSSEIGKEYIVYYQNPQ